MGGVGVVERVGVVGVGRLGRVERSVIPVAIECKRSEFSKEVVTFMGSDTYKSWPNCSGISKL